MEVRSGIPFGELGKLNTLNVTYCYCFFYYLEIHFLCFCLINCTYLIAFVSDKKKRDELYTGIMTVESAFTWCRQCIVMERF